MPSVQDVLNRARSFVSGQNSAVGSILSKARQFGVSQSLPEPINDLQPQTVSFDQPPIGRVPILPSTGQERLPVVNRETFQPPATNPFIDDTVNPEVQLAQLNTGLQQRLSRGGGIFPATRPDSRPITEFHQLLESAKEENLGPLSRPAEFATPLGGIKTGAGAVTGLVGMAAEIEQFFNPIEGDERGRGDKLREFAIGIADMPLEGALQATAVVEDIAKLAIEKATGEQLGDLPTGYILERMTGLPIAERFEQAQANVLTNPEGIPFGAGIGKGIVRGIGSSVGRAKAIARYGVAFSKIARETFGESGLGELAREQFTKRREISDKIVRRESPRTLESLEAQTKETVRPKVDPRVNQVQRRQTGLVDRVPTNVIRDTKKTVKLPAAKPGELPIQEVPKPTVETKPSGLRNEETGKLKKPIEDIKGENIVPFAVGAVAVPTVFALSDEDNLIKTAQAAGLISLSILGKGNIAKPVRNGIMRFTHNTPLARSIHNRYLTIARKVDKEIFLADATTKNWNSDFTNLERQDAGALIEKVDNLETGSKPKSTQRVRTLVGEAKKFFEGSRTKVNEFLKDTGKEEYIKFLEDYLPHFYVGGKGKIGKAVGKWLSSPNAKKRSIPTLQEAKKLGLIPLSQDVAFLGQMWTDINWKIAGNMKAAHLFKNIRHPETRKRMIVLGEQPGVDWVKFDHPALNKTFGRKVGDKLLLQKTGVWVHPELVRTAKIAFDNPLAERGAIARGYDLLNAYAKTAVLTLSGFHAFALAESAQAVLAKASNPIPALVSLSKEGIKPAFRLGKQLERTDPESVALGIEAGLQLGQARADVGYSIVRRHIQGLEARYRDIPGLRWVPKILNKGFGAFDKALWEQIHTGSKIWGYHETLKSELLKLPENVTPEQVTLTRQKVAELMNDAFGGQEWRAKLWVSPRGLQFARRVLLAPDWTLSNLNIAGKTIGQIKDPVARRITMKYWRNMAVSLFGAHQALNYWSTGHFTWDNELGHKTDIDVTKVVREKDRLLSKIIPGFKFDPNDKQRYYIKFGKQAREVTNWIFDPLATIGSKSSPALRGLLLQFYSFEPNSLFPAEWTRKDLTFYQSIPLRLKTFASTFTPFSIRGNNFLFSLPQSKGMTKFKAIRQYQRALEGETWRVLGKPGTKVEALNAIAKAATDNGLNARQLFMTAKSGIISRYYKVMWNAYEDEDIDKANEAAKVLISYGVKAEGVQQSAKRRGIK